MPETAKPAFFRRRAVALLVFLSVTMLTTSLWAHKWAASSFEARTEGREIAFFFRFDSTSIAEVVQRQYPELTELKKTELDPYKSLFTDYVQKHFEVLNNEKRCEQLPFTQYRYAEPTDRAIVDFKVRCPDKLDIVEIISSLFIEEQTPHSIISTFHHIRAKENYLFVGTKSALIRVNKLFQPPAREFKTNGRYLATPPPGVVFGQAPKKEAGPNPVAAQSDAASEEPADPAGPITRQEGMRREVERAVKYDSGFVMFLWQGIIHILGGIDHVLFVISLVLVVYGWRQLGVVVTSFTIAHSITLVLGSLNLVRASPYLVEPLIAASIIYVALENILRKEPKARTAVTFGFGLIHGLGFSSVLQDLGLPPSGIAPALFGFNAGVELGQLMIVGPLFPLVLWMRKKPKVYKRVSLTVCLIVTVIAAWWFFERVMEGINA